MSSNCCNLPYSLSLSLVLFLTLYCAPLHTLTRSNLCFCPRGYEGAHCEYLIDGSSSALSDQQNTFGESKVAVLIGIFGAAVVVVGFLAFYVQHRTRTIELNEDQTGTQGISRNKDGLSSVDIL